MRVADTSAVYDMFLNPNGRKVRLPRPRNVCKFTDDGARRGGPSVTPVHRRAALAAASAGLRACVCTGTSKTPEKPEFRTILKLGLGEAYPWRGAADLAYGALEDTHTEHLAALGSNRG